MNKEIVEHVESEVLGCACPPQRPPHMPPYSGDVFAFASYKKIAPDYESAVQIVYNKRLQIGEPVVVPYLRDNKAELLFAIGSQGDPFLLDSAGTEVNDALVLNPLSGELAPLAEVLLEISKTGGECSVEDLIDEIINNEESAESLSEAIMKSQTFVDLTERVNNIETAIVETSERLGWKSW